MYILRNYLLYMNAREGATNVLSGNHIYHSVEPAMRNNTHIHTRVYARTRAQCTKYTHNVHITHDNVIVVRGDSLSFSRGLCHVFIRERW